MAQGPNAFLVNAEIQLRIKAWRALCAYDASRSSRPVERFVFSCGRKPGQDLRKRKCRREVFLADMPATSADGDELAERFEHRHLSVSEEIVYADVERELLLLIPPTLTGVERAFLSGSIWTPTSARSPQSSASRAQKWRAA